MSIIISKHFISSTFVSDLYGLMWSILYLILSHHTVMWPYNWSNTTLSQMGPYVEFHICMQHYYLAWLHFQLCGRGQLFYYFHGYYLQLFVPNFSDVLTPNPPYILLVETYYGQIIIFLEYNILAYFMGVKLKTMTPLLYLTTGYPHPHRFL